MKIIFFFLPSPECLVRKCMNWCRQVIYDVLGLGLQYVRGTPKVWAYEWPGAPLGLVVSAPQHLSVTRPQYRYYGNAQCGSGQRYIYPWKSIQIASDFACIRLFGCDGGCEMEQIFVCSSLVHSSKFRECPSHCMCHSSSVILLLFLHSDACSICVKDCSLFFMWRTSLYNLSITVNQPIASYIIPVSKHQYIYI